MSLVCFGIADTTSFMILIDSDWLLSLIELKSLPNAYARHHHVTTTLKQSPIAASPPLPAVGGYCDRVGDFIETSRRLACRDPADDGADEEEPFITCQTGVHSSDRFQLALARILALKCTATIRGFHSLPSSAAGTPSGVLTTQ